MKKLCRENLYTFLGDRSWEKDSYGLRLRYTDIDNLPAKREIIFYDFDSAYDYLSGHIIFSASAWRTELFKKPRISYKSCWDDIQSREVMTKKNFKPFGEKCVWEEDTDRHTITTLSWALPADEFIEYCKDHGMAFCPLNRNQV